MCPKPDLAGHNPLKFMVNVSVNVLACDSSDAVECIPGVMFHVTLLVVPEGRSYRNAVPTNSFLATLPLKTMGFLSTVQVMLVPSSSVPDSRS